MTIPPALLAALLLLAGPDPADPAGWVRQGVLARLNRERATAGLRPLALDDRLVRVAQQEAEEIARRGVRAYEEAALRETFRHTRHRLARAAYEPHGWSESWALGGGGDLERIVGGADGVLAQARDGDYAHLGVGFSRHDGLPVYTFLLAWPEAEFFARQTTGLADRDAARQAMLAQANALRRAAGAPPLALDPRLNIAAQRHAEDMLARSFYAHDTPEGQGPGERVRAAGYPAPALVGENIARGALSVEEALAGWTRSREHRKNLLHGAFTGLGVGYAAGRDADGWTVVWVQDFARPKTPGT